MVCPICGTFLYKLRRLFECLKCELVFDETPPDPLVYNESYLAEFKSRDNTEAGRRLTEIRLDMVWKLFKEGHLLDFGPGGGRFLEESKRHFEAHSLDINPNSNPTYSCIEEVQPETYDVITFWDSLEHLENPLTMLMDARMVLKPGGMVFISTPNIWPTIDAISSHHYKPGEHVYYFNMVSLHKMLDLARFSPMFFNYDESEVRNVTETNILSAGARKCS